MGDEANFDVIAIVGVGLIGGSLGMAARARGLTKRVIGIGRNEARLDRAKQLNAIDSYTLDRSQGVAEADLVVVCTPVRDIVPNIKAFAGSLKEGAIVTDVGSTKAEVVSGAEAVLGAGPHFVGGHPMAGSEASGVEAARPDLFEGAAYIITPTDRTNLSAMRKMLKFAKAIGARTIVMSPEEHDYATALVSHVPHVLAAAALSIANEAEEEHPGDIFSIAAGSFRDLTRVSGSPPALWRDICLSNSEAVAAALLRFEKELAAIREVIESGDCDAVENLFKRASELREMLIRSRE
ncbi:MAG: prephenate dehydrogenase [Armatimonadota bacterium]|nr:prephenate dehydrogenase [Armatimonadota bacterium]